MGLRTQLQLLSFLAGLCYALVCASQAREAGSYASAASGTQYPISVDLSFDGNPPFFSAYDGPGALKSRSREIQGRLRELVTHSSPLQRDIVRADSVNELALVRSASTPSQQERSLDSDEFQIRAAAVVTDELHLVKVESASGGQSQVISGDRSNPLAEQRLDPPAAQEQSPDGTAPSRPDYEDLWARMRAGFAMPQLYSPLVQRHIQNYTYKPEYLERMFDRGSRYLFYIVEEIDRRRMPGELALLPFVESAMNPTATSPAKAAGLWQFIPSTGKAYNLSQNWWVDNRRDPVHSTQAALEYLQRIYELQGNDWFLALASYNWGEGAVGNAMRRNQASGRPADYLSLNMPQETRQYVPKLMALREIVLNPSLYNVRLPALPNKPYFVEVESPLHLDLKLAARFAGLSEQEFVSLNPAHNRPVIAARTNDQIKIPADRLDSFLAAMRAHEDANKPFSKWRPYTLARGESIQSLASRLGTSGHEIMRANGLRAATVLPGTRLLVPTHDEELTDSTVMTNFAGPRILERVQRPATYHRVGKKETTESIARRYGITTASLQAWNNLKHEVKLGTRLLVKPASAQTVRTDKSGVSKVIATVEVVPTQLIEDSNREVRPQDGVAQSKVNSKHLAEKKNSRLPKAKLKKDQKQQGVDPRKPVKTSTQGTTKPPAELPKTTAHTTTESARKASGGNNPSADKTSRQKSSHGT